MKLFRFSVMSAIVGLSALLLGSCSEDEGIDNRDRDYGYVQFKLYKEASYEPVSQSGAAAKAVKPQLDYLSEASKVKVTLVSGDQTITQSLVLSYADKETAEFGMRSEKLRLLTGEYQIAAFELYDAVDQPIYRSSPDNNTFQVQAGGLTSHDMTVNVSPRGKVRFSFIKDISGFEPPKTRSVTRQYTLDEIAYVDLTVRNNADNKITKFQRLKTEFSIHFKENNEENNTPGYQTSSLTCDSVLWLPAGEYTVRSYTTYDSGKIALEDRVSLTNSTFTVVDNALTDAEVDVALYEADAYIQDYYALYEIWKALDGPNWAYKGENYPRGANWDFNKDPDLWGYQPGVELHSNGRVAKISISDFGFGGHVPDQIGQLSELIEFYLGSHSDYNILPEDPSPSLNLSPGERARYRREYHKKYLEALHPVTQFSAPIAMALKENNISSPAIALYEKYSEEELIDRATGRQLVIRPYDTSHGSISNRLEYISEEIGKLKKLENLSIANSTIQRLPEALSQLEACTDLEIYNCPNMTDFPMVVTKMPALISVNFSDNGQWSSDQLYTGLDELAKADGRKEVPTIQIIYCVNNLLREVPESFNQLKSLGFLDLSFNRIETIHPLGREIKLTKLYLDHNNLSTIPSKDGYFCGTDDMENFSVTYNKLQLVPDIFSAKSKFGMGTVDFSYNEITGVENGDAYKGINTKHLSLAGNTGLGTYPRIFSKSLIMEIDVRACGITEIPEGSFKGENTHMITALDLSYNKLTKLPAELNAENLPYLTGIELSFNMFDKFPWGPLNCSALTTYAIRGQRDANGKRCLREWPTGIYNHAALRGFFIGSNDLRKIDDTISYLIYVLDISDNPNITFDASGICYYWKQGAYNLIYDKTQNITGCDDMLK